jgi:putative tricarboxylic transport membrane protein
MNPDIYEGFVKSAQLLSLLATCAGSFIGLIVGMIPGMTISAGIIIVLPLTFVLPPSISISLLLGLYAGGMMGGSFSAILLKIPGTPSASATALDGYPLASSGRAHIALSTAIISSFLGGLFSFICLYFIAPELAEVALSFRAPDLFSLVFFGLSVICSFATKSIIKGLLSGIIGLLFVSIGQDPVMGTERFTFGNPDLLSGIHFLTALIGLFAIPQLADNLRESTKNFNHDRKNSKIKGLLPSLKNLKIMRLPILIGSFLGTFIGILPGAGGPIAAFISYDYTKKINKNPKKFGEGCIEGVAAPESANNAVCGGALIPMMTLGIPGDPVTAILIGALLVHGLAPGPLLFMEQAPFAYSVIFSFFWANLFNLLIAMSTLPLLIKLLKTPKSLLLPIIAVLCVVGSFALRNSFFDVYIMFAFGLLGLFMKWLDMPVVPLLLALVLGRQLEEHMRIALTSSQGDISIFFTSPISIFFLCLSAISISWPIFFRRRKKLSL